MIITKTPFRISLFGGGTDYPVWYNQHGGAVLGFALNYYCWISLRKLPPFFEYRHRAVYSTTELINSPQDIKHPSVRAVWQDTGVAEEFGLEMHHDGDLPARSGLGSSSSFTVGLLNAVHALRGRMIDKHTLAKEAVRIEQNVIQEAVGSQDQVWAAFGGLNRIDFSTSGFSVKPLILSAARTAELLDHLLMFFTGLQRNAPVLAQKQIDNFAAQETKLHRLRDTVDIAETILTNGTDLIQLGWLLQETWELKRGLADGVSTSITDSIYQAARDAGALGGKLMGAGGGGFMLLFVPPHRHRFVREALSPLIEVKVGIDREGSKVVLYEPNGL